MENDMQEASMNTRIVPAAFGPLKGAHANARITGPCGDTMEFWLNVQGGKISDVGFTTDGCEHSILCGSTAAGLARGKTLENVESINQSMILATAGNIPAESEHCALLAANTLLSAIQQYRVRYNLPQKKSTHEECKSCSDNSCSAKNVQPGERPEDFEVRQALKKRLCRISHKIIVLSGKGGVGKSTVAVNLATALFHTGKRVGLLDADMHGPSMPTMLKTGNVPIMTDGQSILPVQINGLKVMSTGFLSEQRDEAIIWRGPMKMSVIRQFLKDVDWGELDYLVIDSPPGTGDEPLALCQLIDDADGAIVVTTPQEVAAADVRKSVNFCRVLDLPVLGIIENMSGFVCPKCGEVTNIFNSGGGEKIAEEFHIPFLGKIPVDPAVGKACDEGTPYLHKGNRSETAKAFEKVITGVLEQLKTA